MYRFDFELNQRWICENKPAEIPMDRREQANHRNDAIERKRRHDFGYLHKVGNKHFLEIEPASRSPNQLKSESKQKINWTKEKQKKAPPKDIYVAQKFEIAIPLSYTERDWSYSSPNKKMMP